MIVCADVVASGVVLVKVVMLVAGGVVVVSCVTAQTTCGRVATAASHIRMDIVTVVTMVAIMAAIIIVTMQVPVVMPTRSAVRLCRHFLHECVRRDAPPQPAGHMLGHCGSQQSHPGITFRDECHVGC